MADNMMASAAAAYARSAAEMNKLPTLESAKGPEESDFSDLLKQAVQEAADIGYKSERMSLAAAAGTADVNEVITAVAEAEVTLQAVVTVRDKVIQAYQDIIKMPI
ncbi:flagellar hook-basal body complex protein FliE [Terasakiella sp. A23]|uniref:flagellar hook-basal body complex protein FliE n=1 Tax=Terasakiella sp. FCG-A23 TaxID=3080561 RepID=UPI002952C34A|nr:flagellar hook-basal body complex protein FliE [Terasakiella sp. A23]MDV7339087.1 flagellar hook-basal body complex protein FliE [Terasakiella sp. A23]